MAYRTWLEKHRKNSEISTPPPSRSLESAPGAVATASPKPTLPGELTGAANNREADGNVGRLGRDVLVAASMAGGKSVIYDFATRKVRAPRRRARQSVLAPLPPMPPRPAVVLPFPGLRATPDPRSAA